MQTKCSFFRILFVLFCADVYLNFLSFASSDNVVEIADSEAEAIRLFAAFVEKYGRTYQSAHERDRRFQNFKALTCLNSLKKDTLARIRQRNTAHATSSQDSKSIPFGITRYSDLTPDEFTQTVLRHPMRNKSATNFIKNLAASQVLGGALSRRKRRDAVTVTVGRGIRSQLPKRVDWRDSSVVNPVRNQGECGACWAVSTVETLESMYAIRTGHLPLLSIQQVIDCAEDGNFGCLGGDTCMALYWMSSTKVHLVSDRDYPFVRATGTCKKPNSTTGIQLKDFTCDDYTNREDAMMELLANHGPLVVAVDAVTWQDYLGGIIRFHCEAVHNHAVQIVGYDATGPITYYIIRNSWGPDFGINGYLHVAVGGNLCGIANEVSTLDALV